MGIAKRISKLFLIEVKACLLWFLLFLKRIVLL